MKQYSRDHRKNGKIARYYGTYREGECDCGRVREVWSVVWSYTEGGKREVAKFGSGHPIVAVGIIVNK